ncbi:DNA translocase FtsK 4TM domain-containing protein [Lancefieldella rimae]
MPAKRSSNAAKRGTRSGRSTLSKGLTPVQNDIIGVVLAVLAIALFVSVLVPTSAVVTHATGHALRLCFGTGAPLFPIALFVVAMTFFMRNERSISARIATGLVLDVLAALALISLNFPGAEANPQSLLYAANLEAAGGYVGGGIALLLLQLLGRIVGNIFLCGVLIAGIVVCGFSISDMVMRASGRLDDLREEHRLRKEERLAKQEETSWDEGDAAPQNKRGRKESRRPSLFDETGEGKTTFIGDRKTSVLRRRAQKFEEDEAREDAGDAPTSLLDKAKTTLLAQDTHAEKDDSGSLDTQTSGKTRKKSGSRKQKHDVPDFLANPDALKRPGDDDSTYELPPFSLLKTNANSGKSAVSQDELEATAQRLQSTLEEFGLSSQVVGWVSGPSVTTFKISMGEGERVNKITNLEDDIALSLAAKSVRIFAPIPGTSLVGIEIPNEKSQAVNLADVLPYAKGGPLECAFGRDSEGKPIVVDLASLPHLLVAGTTGSGKSVLLNAIVMSMLMRTTPEQVRLIMVDPKRVEFTGYAGLPHLYVPVVTEPRQAASALQWGVTEMERRLKVFEHYKVREIKTYNRNVDGGKYADMENPPKHMPYFVIVIDELADLMMVAGKDVESSIVRIAQLGRAAGIHLIVATQRPSADVVTGLIRANIDNRVALSVDNSINSRIILDQKGAEQLLGRGDMLVKLRGSKPKRAQGCWVSDEEIEQTVKYIREQRTAEYHDNILTVAVPSQVDGGASAGASREDDPLIWEAARIIVDSQLGSTSSLQRALSVGYARAGRIMDMLEAKGVVGPANGSKPREVLIDKDALEELKVQDAAYKEVE